MCGADCAALMTATGQMVAILAAALSEGLPAVEAACAEALSQGVHSSSVILSILVRKKDPGPAVTIATPEALPY